MPDSVRVDLATELNRRQNTLPHRLLGGVGRHVDLVVADVRLRKSRVVASHRSDRVRVVLTCDIEGQLCTACHKLHVQPFVLLVETTEYLPEHIFECLVLDLFVFKALLLIILKLYLRCQIMCAFAKCPYQWSAFRMLFPLRTSRCKPL